MIVQDVTALPTFNPHGGPITHSSTGSKPDSPVPPCTEGCSSRVASYVIHEPPSIWYQTNTYSRGFEPLSCHISGIKRLPARSKLPRIPPYSALDIFLSFNSRVTFGHLPRCYRPDSQPCRDRFFRNTHTLFFHKYDGVPEERMPTSSWWPEAEEWRHQHNGSTTSRRASQNEKTR